MLVLKAWPWIWKLTRFLKLKFFLTNMAQSIRWKYSVSQNLPSNMFQTTRINFEKTSAILDAASCIWKWILRFLTILIWATKLESTVRISVVCVFYGVKKYTILTVRKKHEHFGIWTRETQNKEEMTSLIFQTNRVVVLGIFVGIDRSFFHIDIILNVTV